MSSTKNSNLFIFSNDKSPKNFSYKNKEDTYNDEDDIYSDINIEEKIPITPRKNSKVNLFISSKK